MARVQRSLLTVLDRSTKIGPFFKRKWGDTMRLLSIFFSLFLMGSSAFAGIDLSTKFLLPGVNYVLTGATLSTSAGNPGGTNILTRSEDGKTFYLSYFSVSGQFDTVSATATRLGSCSLQVPTGTTIATWFITNPTTSAADRVVVTPAYPIPVTSSMAISCAPLTATKTDWYVNFAGFEY